MRVNVNSWHARIFFYETRRQKKAWSQHTVTNRCDYLKNVLFRFPLRMMARVICLLTFPASILIPMVHAGPVAGLLAALSLPVAITSIVLLLATLSWIFCEGIPKCLYHFKKGRPRQEPNFFDLFRMWFRARKEKFCPMVDFYSEDEKNA